MVMPFFQHNRSPFPELDTCGGRPAELSLSSVIEVFVSHVWRDDASLGSGDTFYRWLLSIACLL